MGILTLRLRWIWRISCLGLVVPGIAVANSVVQYEVTAESRLIDKFRNPLSGASLINPASAPRFVELNQPLYGPARSLGLTKLKIDLHIVAGHKSTLHIGLRPDATNISVPGESKKEFDSRAGQNGVDYQYYANTDLHLLDDFNFEYRPTKSLHVGVGVFSFLKNPSRAYQPMLDFSGAVWFPRKFMGVKLAGNSFKSQPALPQQAASLGFSYELFVFEGRNDRADSLQYRAGSDSHDIAPEGKDIYQGIGINSDYRVSQSYGLAITLGTDTAEDGDGQFNDVFGGISQFYEGKLNDRSFRLAADFRAEERRGHYPGRASPTLLQASFELTFAYMVSAKMQSTLGLHIAQGANNLKDSPTEKVELEGWQFSGGLKYFITEALKLRLEGVHERRMAIFDGVRTGSFGMDGVPENEVKRYAIGVDYFTGSSF